MKQFAQEALVNILRSNKPLRGPLFSRVVDFCYSSQHKVASWTFYTLVDSYLRGKIPIYPHVLLCLALHKMGDSVERVRKAATSLMSALIEEHFPGEYTLMQNTGVFDCYYQSQVKVAKQIARQHPSISSDFLENAFIRFRDVDGPSRERFLHIMESFLINVDLSPSAKDEKAVCCFLERLLVVTLKYGEEFTGRVEAAWVCLSHSEVNAVAIVNYLVSLCVNRRGNSLVETACKVVLLVSRAQSQAVVDKLVFELTLTEKVGQVISQEMEDEMNELSIMAQAKMPSNWAKDFCFMFPTALRLPTLSRSNVAIILLTELIQECFEHVSPHLAQLLFMTFLALDSSNKKVVRYAKVALANVLFASLGSSAYLKLTELTSQLTETTEPLWRKTEYLCHDGHLVGNESDALYKFVSEYINALKGFDSLLPAKVAAFALRWSNKALWAHYISRSLQIFRIMSVSMSPEALYHILHCVWRHLATRDASGSRAVMFEALSTLHSLAATVTPQSLAQLPQLWWAILSFLQSDCEAEYWLSLDLLAVILQQFDFDNEQFMDAMIGAPPGAWAAPFTGIQPLVMKGITSEKVEINARALLTEFLTIDCPGLIDSKETRFLDNVIPLLPFLLENIMNTDEEAQEETIRVAKNILAMSKEQGWDGITPVLSNYLEGEYNDASVFLQELAGPLHKYLIKNHELRTFSLLRTYVCFGKLPLNVFESY